MLKEFIAQLEGEVEKKQALLKKAYDLREARVKENKDLLDEYSNVGAAHPGFSNTDPSL